jgi:hypothetical protein
MADQGRWFKLWTSTISDPDLRNLPLADFARWCRFGVFLKLHGSDGQITLRSPGIALQELFEVHTFEDAITVLHTFPNCTVLPVTESSVTYSVTWRNWHKYQDDNSLDRTRRWRERTRLGVTPKKRREEMRRDKEKKYQEKKADPAENGVDFEEQNNPPIHTLPGGRFRGSTRIAWPGLPDGAPCMHRCLPDDPSHICIPDERRQQHHA